jgi:hypothetical protein
VGNNEEEKRMILCPGAGDPDPEPYVFGPSGSDSGSFYHQANTVIKTSIPPDLVLLYDFLSLKNDVNVASKSIN